MTVNELGLAPKEARSRRREEAHGGGFCASFRAPPAAVVSREED